MENHKITTTHIPQQKMQNEIWKQPTRRDHSVSTIAATSSPTAPLIISTEILLTEEIILNKIQSTEIVLTEEIILDKIHKKIVSKEEIIQNSTVAVPTTAPDTVLNKEVVLNLDVIDDDDDEIDNAKFQSSIVAILTTITLVIHNKFLSNDNVSKDNQSSSLNMNSSKEEGKKPKTVV